MIAQRIIEGFFDVVIFMIHQIPMISFSIDASAGIASVITLITGTGYWVPWNVIIPCVCWCIVLYNTRFMVQLVTWLVERIPVIG